MRQAQIQHAWRQIAAGALCAAGLCLACVSCEAPPADAGSDTPTSTATTQNGNANPASHWRAVPVRVRVYPSTRFIQESGRAILEARFELFDEMGDPVKSAGTFQIELYSIDENLGNTPQRLLYTWSADTFTLADQREHFDPITRGYLFRLGVENLRIAKQATLLKVAFTPIDRPRLEAEAVIRSDW